VCFCLFQWVGGGCSGLQCGAGCGGGGGWGGGGGGVDLSNNMLGQVGKELLRKASLAAVPPIHLIV